MGTATIVVGMAITDNDDGTYTVESTSGKSYTVRYCGSGDGDPEYMALWECNCPAAQFNPGKLCKHVRAVIDTFNRS